MVILTIIGLFFIFFSFQYPLTPSIYIDVIPSFVGFLILWYVGEKLQTKTKWFKESSISAASLAAVHFIGYASSFKNLLPENTTFADSDIFRFMFTGISYVYENGHLIFASLSFIYLQFLCRALGNIAEEKDNKIMTVVFLVLCWLFIILIPLYIVMNFVTLPFDYRFVMYPIEIIFMAIAAIFMKTNDLD